MTPFLLKCLVAGKVALFCQIPEVLGIFSQAFATAERTRAWAEMVVAAKIDSQLAAARHYQRQGVPAVDRWVISLCNQGRIAADDFQEEGGGIRLQPRSFGKILVDWETHWIRQGQETALDEWVARCACHVRHGEPETDLIADDPA